MTQDDIIHMWQLANKAFGFETFGWDPIMREFGELIADHAAGECVLAGAEERESAENRVMTLYETMETPLLVDVCRAIRGKE